MLWFKTNFTYFAVYLFHFFGCSDSGEGCGFEKASDSEVSVSLQGDRTARHREDRLPPGVRGPQRSGSSPSEKINGGKWKPISCCKPFHFLVFIHQSKGNASSAFSPYVINTVQIGNQEKYLIVSIRPAALWPLTPAWPASLLSFLCSWTRWMWKRSSSRRRTPPATLLVSCTTPAIPIPSTTAPASTRSVLRSRSRSQRWKVDVQVFLPGFWVQLRKINQTKVML